jgi:hypothetical protein
MVECCVRFVVFGAWLSETRRGRLLKKPSDLAEQSFACVAGFFSLSGSLSD